ncbi:MAG: hypothetical protein HC850_09275 [Rhodomicrobium sp.]|nr:hypothetical protein [Rhodomicrobium sp.]
MLAQLAVLSLILQLFPATFHAQQLSTAQTMSRGAPQGFLVICTGNGVRLVAQNADHPPGGKPVRGGMLIDCPVCQSGAAPAHALAGPVTYPASVNDAFRHWRPAPVAANRDHRPAIRAGHDPPASL